MAKASKSPYNALTEDTRNYLSGNKNSYVVNQVYKSTDGRIFYYINSRGFYHVLMPKKNNIVKGHFVIDDLLLTKENTMKSTGILGNFDSKKDCISALEQMLEQEVNNAESN